MVPHSDPRQRLQELRGQIAQGRAQLEPWEEAWRDKQKLFEGHGYKLRARYQPGWIPSWVRDPSLTPRDCEDYHIALPLSNLTDATRVSDNKLVSIKIVATGSDEVKIATMLYSEELRADPRNHCVPVLEVFQDDGDSSVSYLVMPFLRPIDDPAFETVSDVVDFVDQILEGLVFLHEHGVAHRDCELANLLMDATSLYPKGFHPVETDYLPEGRGVAPQLPRRKGHVKYYYADFGISVYFPPDAPSKLVIGDHGRDQDVPELSNTEAYDPYKVDVFIIGNLFKTFFMATYSNLGFLKVLAAAMTAQSPDARPTAAQALAKWRKIRRWILPAQRGWRVRARDELWFEKLFLDTVAFFALGPWFYGVVKAHAHRLVRRNHTPRT